MATSQAERTRGRVRDIPVLPAIGAALTGWLLPTLVLWVAPLTILVVLLSKHSQRKVITLLIAIAFLAALFVTAEALLLTAEIAT